MRERILIVDDDEDIRTLLEEYLHKNGFEAQSVPDGKGMWVAYGLGNFISNQAQDTVGHPETSNGLVITATFTVAPDGAVDVGVGWTAVTVDRLGDHIVYPITEDTGKVGGLSASTVKSRWQLVANAAGDEAVELTEPGEPLADFVWSTTRTP